MRIVDLSRLISTDTKVFPNSLPPSFIDWTKIDVHGYDSEMVFLSTTLERIWMLHHIFSKMLAL